MKILVARDQLFLQPGIGLLFLDKGLQVCDPRAQVPAVRILECLQRRELLNQLRHFGV